MRSFVQKIWSGLLVILFTACIANSAAYAQCLDGLPCVNGYTPNDPYNQPIDPNTSGPNAEKTDGNMCDADFMNQIYARAWLEAERENIMAQLIISKPDSVLEYSCFEQFKNATAAIAGPLFSESNHWWDKSIPIDGHIGDGNPTWEHYPDVTVNVHMCEGNVPCDKLDKSIELLVLQALKKYVDTEFFHDYIGGFATGFNNDITGQISGNYYLCDFVFLMHDWAKCTDMNVYDHFYTFETLVSLDPRLFPKQCEGTAITWSEISIANNQGFSYVAFDRMTDNYFEQMDIGTCGDPVPTGVRVREKAVDFVGGQGVTATWDEYDEHVCTNPGCTYTPNGGCR